jgi:predicted aspartyl protease
MTTYEYSTVYLPAAPVCQVYLGQAGSEPTSGPFDALLDTGSDITVIPLAYLREVKAKRISRGRARSMWGDARTVDIYLVAFALDQLRFSALQVLAEADGQEIVVGRAVLNRLKILLDGPAALLEIIAKV